MAGSGLPFASTGTGQVLEDAADDDSFEVVISGYVNVEGETTATPAIVTETVRIVQDGRGGLFWEMTYNGETVRFPIANDTASGTTTLDSGVEIDLILDETGAHSQGYAIFTYAYEGDDPQDGQLNADGSFILGFETDPEVVAAAQGTATYEGIFGGFGAVENLSANTIENEVSIEGDITLQVSFDDMDVDADIEGFVGVGDDSASFDGALRDAPIVGNAFSGMLDISCADDANCTSDSSIGGAFYGPDRDEVAGLLSFNVTSNDSDGVRRRYVSGAFFGADDVTQE